ncbi:MAG: hypothetical protein JW893_06965 [Candidatus Omnitrophica bacterium]|nr:hypothetical protein [Candidatus Omnitrophota bacterium]
MANDQAKELCFHYAFRWPDSRKQDFHISLREESLEIVPEKREVYPEWVRLSYCQCSVCPLKEEDHPQCPIASNLIDVISFAKDELSHQEIDVEIDCEARTYRKKTSLQNALSSLIGIYMATSGCPIMDNLRPLVRTHLPFATLQETTYRTVSMYLLAQYFLWKQGKTPDWGLTQLKNLYGQIQQVNEGFRKRIAAIHKEDAGLNAVIHLNCYAWFTNISLLEKDLDEIKRFFSAYLSSGTS